MTPFAQSIVRQNLLPVRERHEDIWADEMGNGGYRLYRDMADVHCFELSAVRDLVWDLAEKFADGSQAPGQLAFLPAPKTWIEWDEGDHEGDFIRSGYLLKERDNAQNFSFTFAQKLRWTYPETGLVNEAVGAKDEYHVWRGTRGSSEERFPLFTDSVRRIALEDRLRGNWTDESDRIPDEIPQLYAALALINSPKVIGRRTHHPHRGLERRLLSQRRMLGAFPLRAWTEIKLEVTPPAFDGDKLPIESRLTGQKALHFCRSHLRVRLGRLEVVRAHWRGDGSLGIKRSRYSLQKGRGGRHEESAG